MKSSEILEELLLSLGSELTHRIFEWVKMLCLFARTLAEGPAMNRPFHNTSVSDAPMLAAHAGG